MRKQNFMNYTEEMKNEGWNKKPIEPKEKKSSPYELSCFIGYPRIEITVTEKLRWPYAWNGFTDLVYDCNEDGDEYVSGWKWQWPIQFIGWHCEVKRVEHLKSEFRRVVLDIDEETVNKIIGGGEGNIPVETLSRIFNKLEISQLQIMKKPKDNHYMKTTFNPKKV